MIDNIPNCASNAGSNGPDVNGDPGDSGDVSPAELDENAGATTAPPSAPWTAGSGGFAPRRKIFGEDIARNGIGYYTGVGAVSGRWAMPPSPFATDRAVDNNGAGAYVTPASPRSWSFDDSANSGPFRRRGGGAVGFLGTAIQQDSGADGISPSADSTEFDPLSAAQRKLGAAQQAATASKQETLSQWQNLGVPLVDAGSAPVDLSDPEAARAHLDDYFDRAARGAEASARQLWSFDQADPASIAGPLRAEIEQRRSAAQAALEDHRQALQAVQSASDQLDQGRTAAMSNPPAVVAAGLTPEHVGQQVETRDGQMGQLRAVGLQKVAFSDGDGNMKVAPIGEAYLANRVRQTDPNGAGPGDRAGQAGWASVAGPGGPSTPPLNALRPDYADPPIPSALSPVEPSTQQSIPDAPAGKKPYSFTADGRFRLSKDRPLDSAIAAVKDGVIANPSAATWQILAQRQAESTGDIRSDYAELAKNPDFNPVDYYAQNPSREALTTAREVFKLRAQQPTNWSGTAGAFVKSIPSAYVGQLKGYAHGAMNLGTEIISADGSPAEQRAKLENAAATQKGLVEGRDLGVGLWRNAQRLIGKTDANLSDQEIEERIQNDAAARQFENAADQGDIERDSWLTGQGTMDADQLRQAGAPVRSGVIDSMSFMGNPATVFSHGAGELLGPTISRTVTAPVLRGTGKALMAVGEAAGKSSGALPAIGRMVAEAGTEAVPGAVPRAGQSLLEKGGKSMARQTMSGTANALPYVAAAQSPQEAAAALGGGLGSVPMGTLHEVFGARPSAPTAQPESASAEPAESPGIRRTSVPPSAEGGAASGFSSADATPPASPSAEPDPAVGGTWGGLTRDHVGQSVETRDGRSGVLKDVGNLNVALRDATGQAHAVPRGDVRLAQPTPPTPPAAEESRPTPISNRSESVSAAASADAPADPARTTSPGQNPSEPTPSSDTDSGNTALPKPLLDQPPAPSRPMASDGSSSGGAPASFSFDQSANAPTSESDPRSYAFKRNGSISESGGAGSQSEKPTRPNSDGSLQTPVKGGGGPLPNLAPEDHAFHITARGPDEGWGEVGPNDTGKIIETQDGRQGRMIGTSRDNRAIFQSGNGPWQYEDFGNLRFVESPGSEFRKFAENEVEAAHQEYAPLFEQLEIPVNRAKGAGMRTAVNEDHDPSNPDSRPVRVSLGQDNVTDHVMQKSTGSEEAGRIIARSVPREELFHGADQLDDHDKFLQSPERAQGMSWGDYRNLEKDRTMADIRSHVENNPVWCCIQSRTKACDQSRTGGGAGEWRRRTGREVFVGGASRTERSPFG